MKSFGASLRVTLFIMVAVFIVACSQSTARAQPTPTITPLPVNSENPTGTVTPPATIAAGGGTVLPTPTSLPLTGALGAVPTNCAALSTLKTVAGSEFGMAVGLDPVWVSGFSGSQAVLHLGAGAAHGQYGWGGTIQWNVRQPFGGPVAIQGFPQGGGAPIWFQLSGQMATTEPDLVANQPGAGSDATWHKYPMQVFVPQAGCYAITGIWNDGSAHIMLAVGQ